MQQEIEMHAEHALTQLARDFDRWRQNRPTRFERIPPLLWEQAIALSQQLPIAQIAKRLRLRGSDLKKRCTAPLAVMAEPTPSPGVCRRDATPSLAPTHLRYRGRPPTSRWRPPAHSLLRAPVPARGAGADLFGSALMLQLTPQSRILLATEPVDFRKGIDGLAAVCRQKLREQPLNGAVFVCRNRAGTALKLLVYDGQGFWLCTKRLSQGRFTWWPRTQETSSRLSARELAIVLWNGNPQQAGMADDWKKLT
jgi:transposase